MRIIKPIAVAALLLAAVATPARAQTTVISRLELTDPDLHYPGGSGLHTVLDNMWIKVGDNLTSRFYTQAGLANSASADFEHNFKQAFSTLRVQLYLWNSGTGALTAITPTSSPSRSQFTIAATPSFLTTKVRVTNNSGSSRDIAVVVLEDPIYLGDEQNVAITSPVGGQALTYDSGTTTWKNTTVSSGGGGGGASWYPPAGTGAPVSEENGQQVYSFPDAVDVELDLWVAVPDSYFAGNQISTQLAAYSPSTAAAFVLQETAYLIRSGTDAVSSTTNSNVATATYTEASPANLLIRHAINLTDGTGKVNGVSVSAGDMLHVVLVRAYANGGDTDTADIRFVPGSTQVRFSP